VACCPDAPTGKRNASHIPLKMQQKRDVVDLADLADLAIW
jgi:hypothetical protein